ncbi:CWF19-like protein 2 homolog [Musca vetustissima]|uniref:CWF19-like protein 2 homolog n=1 Tax=Musca vetustissima TaxID=27455 RepID=UPI002AB76693|nr:CWF19-like protein 2 homolog [Musca vetustissima]
MSYIQFESAREKDKARAELREAREAMLEEAKKRAVQRAEREASKQLKGETNWIHPAVEKKLKKKEKELSKHKNKKDKKKSSKNKKSKSRKKHKHQSSSDERSSNSSSSSEKKKKHKKSKKSSSKKSKKKKANEDCEQEKWVEAPKAEVSLQRDSWMTDALMLKTYSRERPNKSQEKQQIDTYDPAKSSRELNPYWKITGTGLPGFQKPRDDDDHDDSNRHSVRSSTSQSSSRGWRKPGGDTKEQLKESKPPPVTTSARKRSATPPSESSSSSSDNDDHDNHNTEKKESVSTSDFLTDQQMNELAAKILKAEIMGNTAAVEEMREKLEKARVQRNLFKERKKSEIAESRQQNREKSKKKAEEHVLLTHTDQSGQSRPLPASKFVDPRDLYGGKKKQKRVKTHDDEGQRVRYFADDDRYDIKQMFEREKYTTASQANLEFADLAAKNKNPNDDLEDIFAEKICKDDTSREARRERDRAIREHQRMEAVLDNCDRCFDSTKMQKELLVSVGDKVYLALPWYQGLQTGHCMIIPTHHATCCTQLDEDTWEEINDFRKALTRMFAAQRKDVIFFEIANRLHRRPHLVIHCIPIKESEGEMAPFYFKKAIEESEHEWCVNKQLVSLRNKSLRSSIPKGLPYFWVNFGMDTGFAHVIEDEQRFPPNFAQEIIGGMLHLDANKWRRQQKEQNIITKVKMFADWWKKYDCTK